MVPPFVKIYYIKKNHKFFPFVKINGKYYKSQEIYDADQKSKAKRKELIDYVCREFLRYGNGQPFPTSLPKKLNELSFYDDDVILETFKRCASDIHYQMEHKQFSAEYNKIAYMFAIIKQNQLKLNVAIYPALGQKPVERILVAFSTMMSFKEGDWHRFKKVS